VIGIAASAGGVEAPRRVAAGLTAAIRVVLSGAVDDGSAGAVRRVEAGR
jgi:hypothetical protein